TDWRSQAHQTQSPEVGILHLSSPSRSVGVHRPVCSSVRCVTAVNELAEANKALEATLNGAPQGHRSTEVFENG
ncbi:MAG: hypothetical protein KAT27_01825, partial [Desulfobacterales bacterium]|nr:hypothetical protein [Desulfobacterales bacterium]